MSQRRVEVVTEGGARYCTFSRLHWNVNINFIGTERLKMCGTHFIMIFGLFLWSETERAISPQYACNVLQNL